MKLKATRTKVSTATVTTTAVALFLMLSGSQLQAQTDLEVAIYNDQQELVYPAAMDEWVHMGTTLGGDYNENTFDPAKPGVLGVVQMEPQAYRYFKQHGEYADGSMFLLSFYKTESKSSPQLQGFVQGDLQAQEIHVLDKQRFAEGSAFFLYRSPGQASSARVPDGSECIACHTREGGYEATFIQFYPTLKKLR